MTSTHASKRALNTLPPLLKDIYFPPATKPESHVPGKPVKGRNEPCAIGGVAWVIQSLHDNISFENLVEQAWANAVDAFLLKELM